MLLIAWLMNPSSYPQIQYHHSFYIYIIDIFNFPNSPFSHFVVILYNTSDEALEQEPPFLAVLTHFPLYTRKKKRNIL